MLTEFKEWVPVIGLGSTLFGAGLAFKGFWRTEQWKRAEFLAREMKEFFASPRVQSALTMIDWSARRVRLLEATATEDGRVLVTRGMQIRALLPHTLIDLAGGSDQEASAEGPDSELAHFTPAQAAIRDCYDTLLDGLERFSSYMKTDLVTAEELKPYIGYWVHDIAVETDDSEDAAWSAVLLTYIHFYGYQGVRALFTGFGRPIEPTGTVYTRFLEKMNDPDLAAKLAHAAKNPYSPVAAESTAA